MALVIDIVMPRGSKGTQQKQGHMREPEKSTKCINRIYNKIKNNVKCSSLESVM